MLHLLDLMHPISKSVIRDPRFAESTVGLCAANVQSEWGITNRDARLFIGDREQQPGELHDGDGVLDCFASRWIS